MNAQVMPAAPAAATSIAEYSKTAVALAELRDKYQNVVFDVTVPKEMENARKARAELRTLRIDLDKLRLQLNEDDHGRIKKRNEEARRITGELVALEDPIDNTIKAEESRRDRERAEKEAAETARVNSIHVQIAGINAIPSRVVRATTAEISQALEQLRAEIYVADEFQATADDAKTRTIAILEELLASAQAKDAAVAQALAEKAAEEKRFKEEREAFAREREAEKERRDREEQARVVEEGRRIAEDRERAAAVEASERAARLRIDAEQQAARDKIAREEAEARAARKAEAERARAEKAEREAREAADAKAREARQAEEARLKADREQLEEQQREVARREAELLDGGELLRTFVERFGKRREFSSVVKAIREYLANQGPGKQ